MPKIKYIEKRFHGGSERLIGQCNSIIKEYTDQGFVLTLRQLYYQLVSRDIIANKQSEYKRVGSIINDARLAGLIDWYALEDRTRNVEAVPHWDTPEDILHSVAQQYRRDKWITQAIRPEVWIEKDALVGVIDGVCAGLDVAHFSCRGYTSQSEMWSAAQRFIGYARRGQRTHIIHLGDHDPSGIDMSRDITDRIGDFMYYHLGSRSFFQFTRVALNMDQIDEYEPPPNPAKSTDSRFASYQDEHGEESWELDALDPTVLAGLITDQVEKLRDDTPYAIEETREAEERAALAKLSDNYEAVVEYLKGIDDGETA